MAMEYIDNICTQVENGNTHILWPYQTGVAMRNLFERMYWRRIWIIQEILLARQTWVLCGSRIFSWTNLENLVDFIDNLKTLRHTTYVKPIRLVLNTAAIPLIRQKKRMDKLTGFVAERPHRDISTYAELRSQR
jgi:hypothetical protein